MDSGSLLSWWNQAPQSSANPGERPPAQPKGVKLEHLRRHPGSWATQSLRRKAQGPYAESTPLTIAGAIAEANRSLGQANIRLVSVKVNDPVTNSNNKDNGHGVFT